MLKWVKDSLKELSIAILILGLLKLIVYYNNFNVPIKYFLGLSELWLVISDDLLFAAPTIFLTFYASHKIVDIPTNKERMGFSKKDLFEKVFLIIFIIIGLFLVARLFFTKTYYETSINLLTLFLFAFMFIAIFNETFFSVSLKKYFPIFSISLIIFLVLLRGVLDIRSVEHGRYNGTRIVTEKKTYISNDSAYFIGKTEKYIFIYNKPSKSTLILPMDLVIELEIRKNKFNK